MNTPKSLRHGWYVVAVLFLAYTCSFFDRNVLNILVSSIKLEFGVSDSQIGLLQGASFALFYVTAGLFIARLADRHSRKWIIVAGLVMWSLATSSGVLAQSFVSLFLLRILVGVGEASLTPAATSMLSDLFPRERLSTAISAYAAAPYLGSALALVVGGWALDWFSAQESLVLPLIGQRSAWQHTFLVVGLPGLAIAALVALTIREPERSGAQDEHEVSMGRFMAYLRRHGSVYGRHFAGFAMFSLVGYGMAAWLPSLFQRNFGTGNAEIGAFLGSALLIGGISGIMLGGLISDRLSRRRHDGPIILGIIATLGASLGVALLFLAHSQPMASMAVAVAFFFVSMPLGAALAALQVITPAFMRARMTAAYLFTDAIIGLGLGPTLVGFATDFVFRSEAALGASLMLTCLAAMAVSIFCLWTVRRPYSQMAGLRY